MLPLTLRIIRAEHGVLAAMLRTLPQVLSGRREPDFASLRAMLFYVDEFPERLHHPKESELLFPKLRARAASRARRAGPRPRPGRECLS
jgi:hemerythrin-like domain-containing protein